jgi:YtkA-like
MSHRLAAASLLAAAAFVIAPAAAWSAAKDYRFELAGPPAKSGKDTVVKLRLVHAADGKPVPDAVIIQPKADMGPMGMETMTVPVTLLAPAEPGVYQLSLAPSMTGKWALTLSAKVQGEPETVRGTVAVELAK